MKRIGVYFGLLLLGGACCCLAQDVPADSWAASPASSVDAPQASPAAASVDPADTDADRFVPLSPNASQQATLELRGQATVFGSAIHLRQLCRWSSADAPALTPVADLTIAKFPAGSRRTSLSIEQLRITLQDAGVNLGAVRLCGAVSCSITRADADAGDGNLSIADGNRAALQQWIDQATPAKPILAADPAMGANPAGGQLRPTPSSTTSAATGVDQTHTLHALLLTDLSQRLNLSTDVLDVQFDPKDQALLNLSEPNFHFDIRARRAHDLGDVSWDVGIVSGNGGTQRITINASARAWQDQLVMTRPASYRQVLRDEDVEQRRVLIDTLPNAAVLTRDQVVGQEAARDLQPGMVMTARTVEAVPLAKVGQYVTVTLQAGTVSIRTVARAMEAGSYGQSIKVKDEATHDVFEVTLTGPQQATMNAAPTGDQVATNQ